MAVICRACRPAVVAVEMYAVLNPPEEARSYSSVWDNNAIGTGHGRSMLHSPQAWVSLTNTIGQHMTISLGSAQTVVGVITQGRADCCPQWVSSYKVQASQDCTTYIDVDGTARLATTPAWIRFREHWSSPRRAGLPIGGRSFGANSDNPSKVSNFFTAPVQAMQSIYSFFSDNAWELSGLVLRAVVPPSRPAIAASVYAYNREKHVGNAPRPVHCELLNPWKVSVLLCADVQASCIRLMPQTWNQARTSPCTSAPGLGLHPPTNLQWDRLNPANPHCD